MPTGTPSALVACSAAAAAPGIVFAAVLGWWGGGWVCHFFFFFALEVMGCSLIWIVSILDFWIWV